MHQEHKAGEKVLIDYAGASVPIYAQFSDRIEFEAQIFVGCLPASNYCFVYATEDQKLKSWLQSIDLMFSYFGGVPETLVCDNPKSLITETSKYEPKINKTFLHLASHYECAIVPARVRKPKDKALAENCVGNVQRQLLARIRDIKFYSLVELNTKLKELLAEFCQKEMKSYGKSRHELFNEIEKETLKPLPLTPYKLTEFKEARVGIDYHVMADKKFYSVPYQYRGKVVEVRLQFKTVTIYYNAKQIASHLKAEPHAKAYTTNSEHMPQNHKFMSEWSPERFIAWGAQVGVETKAQIEKTLSTKQHPQQAYRGCLGILNFEKTYSTDLLELACKFANKHNVTGYSSIKNILKNNNFHSEQPALELNIVHENIRNNYQ